MMFKDLGRRMMVSSIAVAVAAFMIVFSKWLAVRYTVAIVMGLLSAVAAWEYAQFAKAKKGGFESPALIVLSALVTFSFFCFAQWPLLVPAICLMAIFILFAIHFREKSGAIIDLAVSVFGLLYIALPLGMVLGILFLPMQDDGRMWIAFLLAVTKMADIGAYFGGNLWGRRKLALNISPSKTVEGAVCGLCSALAVSYLFYQIGQHRPELHFFLSGAEWICLGVVLGSIGQFGDLAESLLKRDANKKDSNALPGIGGVLDSVDSLLFNAPIIYFYIIAART
jgi:phosphatidate cytidylyltransferase